MNDVKCETPEEFMNDVREQIKELEKCNFEEFKSNMIAVIDDMYKATLMIFEYNMEDREKLKDIIVDYAKMVRDVNDEDFKKAERNFGHIRKDFDRLSGRIGKAEAMGICSYLRMSSLLVRMVRGGFIPIDEVNNLEQEYKLVPKSAIKFIAELFETTQNSIKSIINKAVKIAA